MRDHVSSPALCRRDRFANDPNFVIKMNIVDSNEKKIVIIGVYSAVTYSIFRNC